MPEQRPPERRSQREERAQYDELHRSSGNGGQGGTRGMNSQRYTEHAPSRRYKWIALAVAIVFIFIIIVVVTGAFSSY